MADSASQKTKYESEIKQLKELRDTQKAMIVLKKHISLF